MGVWFKQFESLLWFGVIVAGVAVWAYTSFATINYVDKKHESVMSVLQDIQTSVRTIDQRTYELARSNK
jgi:hypothetical protein